jgi:hypothetical protein
MIKTLHIQYHERLLGKVKGKVLPRQATKAQKESRGIALLFL